ncbi:LPS export ABC transporter periplasmic protein LptC [Rosettibacter firmus]|uniref:LPS export ABC transporter periplasmic protein LptC n=1 Tax=Rosettibacter firmus TaxID=3111522 RepID=UPI00336C028B
MKIFFYFFIILLLVACKEEKVKPKIENSPVEGEIPIHESWNSKVIFSRDGKLKAILYANHLKKYELQKVTLLEGIKVDFYNNNQQKVTTLTAKFGKVDDTTLDMFAMDSVVAVNDSGTVLSTDELMWRNKDQKILSDKFVSIKSKDEIIEGYGFESDQHLNNYVIYHITYSAVLTNNRKK